MVKTSVQIRFDSSPFAPTIGGGMKRFLALLTLTALFVGCVPSSIPSNARAVNINGSTAYIWPANGSALLSDIRMNWNAQRIEGEGLTRARETDLRDAPFTCSGAEAFAWFKSFGTNDPNIVMPDVKSQLEAKGYGINERPIRQVSGSSFQYQVITKSEQAFFLTWIWTPSNNPTTVSLDVCQVKMKPGSPPSLYTWRPGAPQSLE
jgi:hypothetical protein